MIQFEKGERLTADKLNGLVQYLDGVSGARLGSVAVPVPKQVGGRPGPAWFNDAAAVDATGRSYYDDATQSMVYGPGDCEGLIAGAHWNRQIHELKISDGILHLPLAHVEEHHEIDPEDDTVEYFAGAVDSIDVREGTPATLEHGTICLPLAQSPETEADDKTGEQYEVTAGWAGLLAAAEFTYGISSPVMQAGNLLLPLAEYASGVGIGEPTSIAGALAGVEMVPDLTAPEIRNGRLRLPATGGNSKLAEFEGTVSDVAGGLQAATITAVSAISAHSGVLYFPLAESNDYPCSVATPGALAGAEINSSLTKPEICSGVLYFPAGGATTAPLAWFGRDVGSPVAGTLRGGECAAITAIAAVSGVLYFPLASCDVMPAANDSGSSTCTVCSVTSIPYVPGAVCGAQLDSAATAPYIASGVLYFPQQQGALLGLCDTQGNPHTWEQIEGYAGSRLQVAAITLRTAENDYLTLELHAGKKDGHLHFSFSASSAA